MKVPSGFTWNGKPIPKGFVFQLMLALYGLKQSAYEFNKVLTGYLRSKGFKAIPAERSIFTNGRVFIAIYVDDLLIVSLRAADVEAAKKILKARFKIKETSLCLPPLQQVMSPENSA